MSDLQTTDNLIGSLHNLQISNDSAQAYKGRFAER